MVLKSYLKRYLKSDHNRDHEKMIDKDQILSIDFFFAIKKYLSSGNIFDMVEFKRKLICCITMKDQSSWLRYQNFFFVENPINLLFVLN